ncbi:division/outer membrane stress-associated lipid-binding lipoprotein [Rheinheimera sp.]|jgi:osmotically-inducible protein OsmY|uniref:division/outer membrane stress-associated lipid-binding lipoprotein n=1 Tax=Rheinheimera sp. TaxID=1869214 RepID=UPI0026151315|nr:division/outer membrane stress-associated lipid-binding lipoprotein [Rheinheimera sp.]MCA1929244.1 divisome-associated lipoprotein YraP [Rheinheimera sp.]
MLNKLILVLATSWLLQGCAAAVLAGGATAVTSAGDPRSLGSQIDDKSIQVKVLRALDENPETKKKGNINMTSYNGIVLLTGQVPNERVREVAGEVSRVEGVKDVHNQLRVGSEISFGTASKDSWITTRIKSKFLADKNVSGLNVKVVTENGEVFLMGLVSQQEADRAVALARNVDGVARVIKAFEYKD